MTIKIPCNKEEQFRLIIEILASSISPLNKLRAREKDVLSQYYYYNWLHKDIPEQYRNSVTFSSEVRDKICGKLGISKDNLYNITLDLRKRKLLSEDGFGKNVLTDSDKIEFVFVNNNN